jgi:hypothetical protein
MLVMKKIINILGIVLVWLSFSSLSPDYVPTPAEVDHFYQTKTLVVLENNPIAEYNFVIRDFMQKEWKLTPYDFIKYSEFEEKRMDPQYSFILLNQVRFDKDKSLAKYIFLSLVLGGNEQVVSNMPDLCPVPIAYAEVDEDHYNYKLQTILRFMQQHVELIHNNPKLIKTNMFSIYNDSIKNIHNKIFYVIKDELAPDCNTEAKIKKIYPYKFKIVTREEVAKAIDERNPDVVFLHKVGPEGTRLVARCYKIIVGAADSKFYYFDFHKISKDKPDGFLASDFKKLAKK